MSAVRPLPEKVRAAIRKTNLAYLYGETEARECELKAPRAFMVRCEDGIIRTRTLPAGTKVWAFKHERLSYSEYVRIDDWELPKKGAEIYSTGADWTLISIEYGLPADAYVITEPTEPRKIGEVQ